ncbi:Uncharacterised protein [Mycobacterium tuberculosis]|nr:Uncharacterised protein [Mycobacterium tuberculosis]
MFSAKWRFEMYSNPNKARNATNGKFLATNKEEIFFCEKNVFRKSWVSSTFSSNASDISS